MPTHDCRVSPTSGHPSRRSVRATSPLRWTVATALLALLLALAPKTLALNIHVELSSTSQAVGFDPGAVQLGQIMQAAADYWETIIHDSGTVTVYYGYGTIGGAGVGQACYEDLASPVSPDCLDGADDIVEILPVSAFIEFDSTLPDGVTPRPWFFDPTPLDHSEFDMQQTLTRDLNAGSQTGIYNGTVQPLLEVSYFGLARDDAPADAKNGHDAFSVALHELGHVLGMMNELAIPSLDDGQYDFDMSLVHGASLATYTSTISTDHLRPGNALMNDTIAPGSRALPSATDVFAISAAPGWTHIHLPRREFWGGLFWSWPANWAGGSVPDIHTDARVRGGDANLLADGIAGSLVVSDDSRVLTQAHTLQVSGYTTVEQGEGTGTSTIEVEGTLMTGGLRIRQGGEVELVDGQLQTLIIENETGGLLRGHGDATLWIFENNGTLAADGGGTLTLDTTPGDLDLDGNSGQGSVEAIDGNLVLEDTLSDAFNGDMTVGASRSVEMVQPWTVGNGGLVDLNGNSTRLARLEGGLLTLSGTLHASGWGRVVSDLTVLSEATVTVEDGVELELHGINTFSGGTYSGLGTLQLNGDTTVTQSTQLETAIVDLDGDTGNTVIDLDQAILNLDVAQIDTANNVFHGEIHANGWMSRLDLQLDDPAASWTLAGLLDLHGLDVLSSIMLSGSDVVVTGQVLVDGRPRLGADIDLFGTLTTADEHVEVILASGGLNVFRQSAAVTGPGDVVVQSGTSLLLDDGFDEWMRLVNHGTLQPGLGVGDARVWVYTQDATGSLEVEIGGLAPGSDHDRLRTLGSITLDGGLTVQLVNGFVPTPGDSFTVMSSSFGTVNGTWNAADIHLPSLPAGSAWTVDYDIKTVTLSVISTVVR